MKNETTNLSESTVQKYYPIHGELKALAIKATDKRGGVAMIDDRYAIVDTVVYEILLRR